MFFKIIKQDLSVFQSFSICTNLSISKKNLLTNFSRFFIATESSDNQKKVTMKVLNVAEKNDAAKNIAGYLSRGTSQRREGLSKYNKIYEFKYRLWNQNVEMIMTSVSGHLLTFEFGNAFRRWLGCPPISLFDAPVFKLCPKEDYEKIKKTLEKEIKKCNALIIWTDCDREGENIGFEIIQVCKAVKPNIQVYRAKFSEITQVSIDRAINSLEQPNKALSDAVDVRSELDLRIGAAFTRFQTLRLKKKFPTILQDLLISYGPCQFPTLGFVVERFLAIERFQPEPYWKIRVLHTQNDLTVEFRWARNRLFEKLPCEVFLEMCQDNPEATVEKITSKPKSKWRPLPLDTIELEKQGSRKLRLTAKKTMQIAEKLYTQGFISYPRTETNIFPKEMNLQTLVTQQAAEHAPWGRFAQRVLQEGIDPRQGKKSDQAHPPIHPTKYADNLQGDEAKVYEFVVRHFLACVSKNAEGFETIVEIDIAAEKFITNGLQIVAKNYLEVYVYEKWNAKEIHIYQQGQKFMPTSIDMLEESTSAPNLLTEADLIALMDKHGIGTDATHAEHIETIKSRHYVGLKDEKYLIPGKLGIGLVMGYDRMGFEMSKPNLRAELESDLKLICDGLKDPGEVRAQTIDKYREVFKEATEKAVMIDNALAEYLNEQPAVVQEEEIPMPVEEVPILKCPKCNSNMVIKSKRQGNGKYIGCTSYPTCNNVIWFPDTVEEVEAVNEQCGTCPNNILKKIKFKFSRNAFPHFGPIHEACIGGCDEFFNNLIGIRPNSVRRGQILNNDSGYDSTRYNISQRSGSVPSHNRTNRQAPSSVPRNHGNQSQSWSNRNDDFSKNRNSTAIPTNTGNSWNQINHQSNQNTGSLSTQNTSSNTGFSWANNEDQGDIMCHCNQLAKELTVRKEGPNQGRKFYKCSQPAGQGDCNFFLWKQEDNPSIGNSSAVTSAQQSASNNWSQNNWQNNHNQSNSRQYKQDNYNAPEKWANSDEVMCNCRQPASILTVNKDGPNKGRQFFGCPKGPRSTCNFFKWADEAEQGGAGNGYGNRGSTHNEGGGYGEGGRGGGYSGYSGGYQNNDWAPSTRGRGRGRGGGSGGSTASKKSASKTQGGGGTKRKCGTCGIEGHTKRTCPNNRE